MRKPFIAGNWKMHRLASESAAWLEEFERGLAEVDRSRCDLLLAVPATHLVAMAVAARHAGVALAGQDLSAHDQGPYTGEVSGDMLKDAGASFVIVGHSERRALHGEDDALVAAKLAAARRHGLTPILCVGETEAERDAGRAEEVVLGQLQGALSELPLGAADELVVAYEPVWAIGTGRTATADDAQQMCAAVRGALADLYGKRAEAIRVLYGGSMKPGNAADLLSRADVDGGLIGGASLEVGDLVAIARAA